jgi:hypothetical protein
MESHEAPHGEFDRIERRLREERVTATNLELDGIKRDIYVRAERRSRAAGPRRFMFMKSRMAITMMLVVGALLSMSGVGLAVSGSSGSGAAATAQYQTETTTNPQTIVPATTTTPPTSTMFSTPSESSPTVNESTPTSTPASAPSKSSAPASANAPASAPSAEPAQQVAATTAGSGSTLPFTGYNAIPILVGGLGLLALGLVMRRQTRRRDI